MISIFKFLWLWLGSSFSSIFLNFKTELTRFWSLMEIQNTLLVSVFRYRSIPTFSNNINVFGQRYKNYIWTWNIIIICKRHYGFNKQFTKSYSQELEQNVYLISLWIYRKLWYHYILFLTRIFSYSCLY